MADIKLKAILRAYSKSPYYEDYARDIYSQEETSSDTPYLRIYKNKLNSDGSVIEGQYEGEWVPLKDYLSNSVLKVSSNGSLEVVGIYAEENGQTLTGDKIYSLLDNIDVAKISEDELDDLFQSSDEGLIKEASNSDIDALIEEL